MVELPGFFAISWKRCRDHSHLEVLAKAPKKATLPNYPQLPAKCQGQGGGQAGHIGQMMPWRYPKSRSHIVQPVEPENAWSLQHDSTIINSINLLAHSCQPFCQQGAHQAVIADNIWTWGFVEEAQCVLPCACLLAGTHGGIEYHHILPQHPGLAEI